MSSSAPPLLVLDTNVVLDWLLFADPRTATLAAAVTSGRVRWIASAPMRAELEDVLARGIASRPGHPTAALVDAFDRWALAAGAEPASAPPALRCTDATDQMFIDLALDQGASALLSRDRAVLRLARRAGALGLRIVVPERWDA